MTQSAIRALLEKWDTYAEQEDNDQWGQERREIYLECRADLVAALAAGEAAETPIQSDEPDPNWCPKCGEPREVCDAYGTCWPKPEAASLSPAVPPQERPSTPTEPPQE